MADMEAAYRTGEKLWAAGVSLLVLRPCDAVYTGNSRYLRRNRRRNGRNMEMQEGIRK